MGSLRCITSCPLDLLSSPSHYFPPFLCLCPIPGHIHVNKRLAQIKDQLERGEEVKGGFLTHLLVTKEMTMEEIYANVTEMLLAGVDTVCVLDYYK